MKTKRKAGRPPGDSAGWKNLFIQVSPASYKILQEKKTQGLGIGRWIDKLIKGGK